VQVLCAAAAAGLLGYTFYPRFAPPAKNQDAAARGSRGG